MVSQNQGPSYFNFNLKTLFSDQLTLPPSPITSSYSRAVILFAYQIIDVLLKQ